MRTTSNIAAIVLLWLLPISCAGVGPSAPISAAIASGEASEETPSPPRRETEWLAIFIEGRKAGHVESVRTIGATEVSTVTTTSMELERGGTTVSFSSVCEVVETPDGEPIRFEKRERGAGVEQTTRGEVSKDGVLSSTVEAAGRIRRSESRWPVGALMTEGQRLETLARGLEDGVSYASLYFDPDLLEAIPVEVLVGPREEIDLLGRVVLGTRMTLQMEIRGAVIESVMYVDDAMNTLKTSTSIMGLAMELVACTKEYALTANDPLDLIRSTLVSSPRPLTATERAGRIAYTLRVDGVETPRFEITAEQSVTKREGFAIVTVDAKTTRRAGGPLPYRGDDPIALEALGPNEWIQSDAPRIEALAAEAIGRAKTAEEAARSIERFVGEYVTEKALSVGYASALEVATSRAGDCTEHALLTAALCRAVGIPARVAFGVVYVEEMMDTRHVFAGHAWTQVLIDDEWVSLDAALRGFDAGHILLGVGDGNPVDFFAAVELIGAIEISDVTAP